MKDTPIELTPREQAVVKEAVKQAVQEVADQLFKQVGKTVVTKFFVLVGVLVVGFLAGKGWIKFF